MAGAQAERPQFRAMDFVAGRSAASGQSNTAANSDYAREVASLTAVAVRTHPRRASQMDFTHGQDKIDLSRIDAIAGGGDDAFTFIGKTAFTHVAGQLRYAKAGTAVIVYGDVSGDGVADFAIRVDNHHAIAAGDFVL